MDQLFIIKVFATIHLHTYTLYTVRKYYYFIC